MSENAPSFERPQSLGEEVANSVSHGIALLLALAATPFLIAAAARRGAAIIVGASVFAGAAVLLYAASTLYHALPDNKAKRALQRLDRAAIFILIAGTYTPFTLGVLRGGWGWSLFGVVWGLAVVGLIFTSIGGIRQTLVSTSLYLGMGWLILIALRPLLFRVPPVGLVWLAAGGVAYTAGAAFYAAERLRYFHFIFHLFVVAGTACHFIAVWRCAG